MRVRLEECLGEIGTMELVANDSVSLCCSSFEFCVDWQFQIYWA